MAKKTHIIDPSDNVAIAVEDIESGEMVTVDRNGEETVEMVDDVQYGHKFAIEELVEGDSIRKYGEIIGTATQPIHIGEHVHVHNVESERGRGDLEHGNGDRTEETT